MEKFCGHLLRRSEGAVRQTWPTRCFQAKMESDALREEVTDWALQLCWILREWTHGTGDMPRVWYFGFDPHSVSENLDNYTGIGDKKD